MSQLTYHLFGNSARLLHILPMLHIAELEDAHIGVLPFCSTHSRPSAQWRHVSSSSHVTAYELVQLIWSCNFHFRRMKRSALWQSYARPS